jgi:hypothetical protein
MSEGSVYSYDMMSSESSVRILADRQQVFAGAAFVRHGHEMSCLLLAGEKPPFVPDDKVAAMLPEGISRKGITADPTLTVKDRYLDLYPEFARVIVLTRLDLRRGNYDVRYVNLDSGLGFTVFTDDFSVFGDVQPAEAERLKKIAVEGLPRYADLFSALLSMIYLPAFVAAFPQSIHELKVSTELHAARDDDEHARKTFAMLSAAECPTHRVIRCFPASDAGKERLAQKVDPPPLEFKTDGYWRPIGPHQIGEGKNGEQVFGRTWVSRHESWSAQSPKSFMLQNRVPNVEGPDPGTIYVQRSPALEPDLYKVGLTRRTVDLRARELSSASGVPLPFGVLASWNVGDCSRVEREIHEKLTAFRINPRREFFHAELSQLIRIVNEVIAQLPSA